MKILILFLGVFLNSPLSFSLVGGQAVDKAAVQRAFHFNFFETQSSYFPEIPVGPRVSVTCGHCAPATRIRPGANGGLFPKVIFPNGLKEGARSTNNLYEGLAAGSYGLPFFKVASYPFDLALIIRSSDEADEGPFISVSKTKIKLHEQLLMLGVNMKNQNVKSTCHDYESPGGYSSGVFQVLDFYSQNVGFIVTGQTPGLNADRVITCPGDSGGHFFRVLPDRSIELVGVNSWGHEDGDSEVHGDAVVVFQDYLTGVGDLTSDGVRQWLSETAKKEDVGICGINLECPSVQSPF